MTCFAATSKDPVLLERLFPGVFLHTRPADLTGPGQRLVVLGRENFVLDHINDEMFDHKMNR